MEERENNRKNDTAPEALSDEALDAVTGGADDLLHPHILTPEELEAQRQKQTDAGGQQTPKLAVNTFT